MSTKKMGLGRSKMQFDQGTTRPATSVETFLGLSSKMHEEVAEVIGAPDDIEEYGDVLQALMDFAELNGIPWHGVCYVRERKKAEKGGYLPARLWTRKDSE